jgi:hypothetical protein
MVDELKNEFEAVHSVDEYYDGPRTGIADYHGRPHVYRSVYLDHVEWNADEDRFELAPVDGGTSFLVRGEFRVREPLLPVASGMLRPLEVRWFAVE